jgi:transposase
MNNQPDTHGVQRNTTWVIHYRQTEYRKITVEATNIEEARIKWANGDGQDEFVATAGDPQIVGDIEEATS